MPITDLLVLPPDVILTPVRDIPPAVRRRLGAAPSDFALGRSRVRASSKVVTADAAALLARFRSPHRVADAVLAYSSERRLDPHATLADSFPLLRDCYAAGYLAPEGSAAARRIEPTLDVGEVIGDAVIQRSAALLEDTEVYQARRPGGRSVAIKIARPGAEERLSPVLAHEAMVLRALGGRGAPALLAEGRFEGRPFLVLAWCTGVSVETRAAELRARGAAGRTALRALLANVARAYARLHGRGVLHGDVQPDNIILSRSDRVTLLDFGCARMGASAPPSRGVVLPYAEAELASAMLHGLPAPESSSLGEQAALAAVCFQLATGQPHVAMPLDRSEALRLLASTGARTFLAAGAEPWPALEDILGRALSISAADRYPGIGQFASALARCPVPRAPRARPTVAPSDTTRAINELLARDPRGTVHSIRPPRCSVMLGVGGTIHGMYRLACVRDDARLLAAAQGWLAVADDERGKPAAFRSAARGLGAEVVGHVSPYYTATGLLVLGGLLALAGGQLEAAASFCERYAAIVVPDEAGLDLAMGGAGILLGAVLLLDATPREVRLGAPALAEFGDAIHDRLAGALRAFDSFPDSGPLANAGMAHGWGGVLYAMLRWRRARCQSPTPAVLSAVSRLMRLAIPDGRGVRFPHAPDGSTHHDIPGWCNGPAGLVHLFALAARLTDRDRFMQMAESCGWAAWEAGDQSPDLCCGITGRCYALLQLHQATGNRVWLERAHALRCRAGRGFPRGLDGQLSLYKGALGQLVLDAELEQPELACHPFFGIEGWPTLTSDA